jgi:hypothetical protein
MKTLIVTTLLIAVGIATPYQRIGKFPFNLTVNGVVLTIFTSNFISFLDPGRDHYHQTSQAGRANPQTVRAEGMCHRLFVLTGVLNYLNGRIASTCTEWK